ncbi:hypothetical protein J6590_021489 [Homalodisca vitripennis]|nr:hypothetical protein J6590_021489 [Homalodisca vitripennis]
MGRMSATCDHCTIPPPVDNTVSARLPERYVTRVSHRYIARISVTMHIVWPTILSCPDYPAGSRGLTFSGPSRVTGLPSCHVRIIQQVAAVLHSLGRAALQAYHPVMSGLSSRPTILSCPDYPAGSRGLTFSGQGAYHPVRISSRAVYFWPSRVTGLPSCHVRIIQQVAAAFIQAEPRYRPTILSCPDYPAGSRGLTFLGRAALQAIMSCPDYPAGSRGLTFSGPSRVTGHHVMSGLSNR